MPICRAAASISRSTMNTASGPPRPAIGADRRGVGHHRLHFEMHQRQVIDAGLHERAEHQRNDVRGPRRVRSGAADRAHAIGEHAAFGVEREFAGRGEIAAMGAADEFVGAVAAPADLPVQLGRGVSDDAVFGIEARLLAKAAADIADQHAHAVLRPLQDGFREQVPGRAGRLRLHVQDQPAGLLLDLGNRRTWLHRRGHQPLADQIERDFMRGVCKRFLDLGGVGTTPEQVVLGRARPARHRGEGRRDRGEPRQPRALRGDPPADG